ncbi:MAG: PASTA domain-containing protein [Treponemataceae bacterium]|nr:PASTA domain-containing protein [Treponemataceae bacterium]
MKKLPDPRINFHRFMESLQLSWKALLFTSLLTILIMGIAVVAVFFVVVQSEEQVMVPNVIGEQLEDALLEMQAKELYPKLQLRYSNSINEKGTILEQDPPFGTIVNAGRRIDLIVSKGIVVDSVGNYIGQKIDDVRISLASLFSGYSIPLITLSDDPIYQADESEPGTIIEQSPMPETAITSPVTVSLVVSSGPGNETAKLPWLVGKSIDETLLLMSRTKLVFDFNTRELKENEKPGTVVAQKDFTEEPLPVYSRSEVTLAMPDTPIENEVYGIFSTKLGKYPYALKVQIDIIPQEGDSYTLISFKHPGENLTIPYHVPRFSVLVLSVQDKEISRTMIQ